MCLCRLVLDVAGDGLGLLRLGMLQQDGIDLCVSTSEEEKGWMLPWRHRKQCTKQPGNGVRLVPQVRSFDTHVKPGRASICKLLTDIPGQCFYLVLSYFIFLKEELFGRASGAAHVHITRHVARVAPDQISGQPPGCPGPSLSSAPAQM